MRSRLIVNTLAALGPQTACCLRQERAVQAGEPLGCSGRRREQITAGPKKISDADNDGVTIMTVARV